METVVFAARRREGVVVVPVSITYNMSVSIKSKSRLLLTRTSIKMKWLELLTPWTSLLDTVTSWHLNLCFTYLLIIIYLCTLHLDRCTGEHTDHSPKATHLNVCMLSSVWARSCFWIGVSTPHQIFPGPLFLFTLYFIITSVDDQDEVARAFDTEPAF
jgi:hypothetical protein